MVSPRKESIEPQRLLLIIFLSVVAAVAISIWILFSISLSQKQIDLLEKIEREKELIIAVGRFDQKYSQSDHIGGATGGTLSQVVEAHKSIGLALKYQSSVHLLAKVDDKHLTPIVIDEQNKQSVTSLYGLGGKPIAPPLWLDAISEQIILTHKGIISSGGMIVAFDTFKIADDTYVLTSKVDKIDIISPFIRPIVIIIIVTLLLALFCSLTITRASRAMLRQVGYTQAILDTSPCPIITADKNGDIVDANSAAEAQFGYGKSELIGLNVAVLGHGINKQTHTQNIRNYIRTGKSDVVGKTREVLAVRKNGQFFHVNLGIGHMKEGDKDFFVGFMVDISQQKEVAERLLSEKLKAESAVKAKSRFLAQMSHELRTPLNAIIGFSKLLLRTNTSDMSVKEKAQDIHEAGKNLLSLINNILEISNFDKSTSDASLKPFSLLAQLSIIEGGVRAQIEAKGLDFEVTFDPKLPVYVNGYENFTFVILTKLLDNALKYTYQGKVGFRVWPEGNNVVFEVSDTGSGIPIDEQEIVFDAFYRVETEVPIADGSGLGLSICREYVQFMDGQLTLVSEPGQGSIFTVRLPLSEANPADIEEESTNDQRVISLKDNTVAPKILVVDDKKNNRELVNQLLKLVGFDTRVAANGEEAVSIFKEWQPQLIVMDMMMPVMNGYQATRTIRTEEGGKDVKIVALTASIMEEDHQAVMEAGCDAILRKPFLETDLFKELASQLKVDYIYEQEDEKPIQSEIKPGFKMDSIPDSLRLALQAEATKLDVNATCQAINNIKEYLKSSQQAYAEIESLERLAKNFDFDSIIKLCAEAGENSQ